MPDETLLVLLDEVRGRTIRYHRGVADERARKCPPRIRNTILWHVGHSDFLPEWLGMRALGHEVRAAGVHNGDAASCIY
jgi:hypothetical protein